jgi:hypothetical protein
VTILKAQTLRGERLDVLQEKPAPLLGTYAAIALMGFIPLWILSSTDDGSTGAWAGSLIAVLIAGARFSWIVASSRRRLFEMTAWLFIYVFFGLAPLVQLRDQVDPETTPRLIHEHDWTSVLIVLLSEVALIAGSTMGARVDTKPRSEPRRVVDQTRTGIMLTILIVAAGAYVALVGFQPLIGLSRNARDLAVAALITDDTVRPLVGAFVSMGLLVGIVAQIQVQALRKAAGRSRSFLLVVAGCGLLLVIVNPISSPRFVFLTVALGLIAAFGVYRRIRVYRALSLTALGAMFLVFPLLDLFRNSLDGVIVDSDPLASLKGGDFDSFAQIINTATYVDANGITWGNQLLGVVLFWVPRSLWAEKPTDTGILLAEFKDYWFTNLSAPIPSELFINGGWALLTVGLLLLGYLMRQWDRSSETSIQQYGVPTILGCILPAYFVLVLRGSLLQAMSNLAVILLIWFLVTRRASRPAATTGQRPTANATHSRVR